MTFVDPHRRTLGEADVPLDTDLPDLSDASLLAAARSGVSEAALLLLERHAASVRRLADEVGLERFHTSFDTLLERVTNGESLELPVRMAWLKILVATEAASPSALEPRWGRDLVWSSFLRMPVAWQTAIWHHVVEGDSPAEMGKLLGLSDFAARRAVTNAAGAMRRSVTQAHELGHTADCERIVGRLVTEAASLLDSGARGELREHAKTCDPCLHLARDLFTLEFDIAGVLTSRVLGSLADAYVRARPGHRTLGDAPRIGSLPVIAERAAKPAALLSVTGMAVFAVLGAMSLGPGPIQRDDQLLGARDVAAGSLIVPTARASSARQDDALAPLTAQLVRDVSPGTSGAASATVATSSTGGETPSVSPADVGGNPVGEPQAPDVDDPDQPEESDPMIETQTPVGDVSVEMDQKTDEVTVEVGPVTITSNLSEPTEIISVDVPSSGGGLLGG